MLQSRLEMESAAIELGRRTIVRDVSLDLSAGDLQVLIGPNGAGKTTLFRAALGLVRPARGAVRLDGRPVSSWRGRERAARIGWLPQQESVQEDVRVLDLVVAARFRFAEARSHGEARALAALARVDAEEFAGRRFLQLSGGEQQRVALAGLLAQEAPLLLLDEPGNHLDPAQQIEIYRLIGRLCAEGFGILCITHDLDLINHARTPGPAAPARKPIRVLGLGDGTLRFAADFADPDLCAHLEDLFQVAVRVVEEEGRRHFLITRPLQETST